MCVCIHTHITGAPGAQSVKYQTLGFCSDRDLFGLGNQALHSSRMPDQWRACLILSLCPIPGTHSSVLSKIFK